MVKKSFNFQMNSYFQSAGLYTEGGTHGETLSLSVIQNSPCYKELGKYLQSATSPDYNPEYYNYKLFQENSCKIDISHLNYKNSHAWPNDRLIAIMNVILSAKMNNIEYNPSMDKISYGYDGPKTNYAERELGMGWVWDQGWNQSQTVLPLKDIIDECMKVLIPKGSGLEYQI